MRAMKHLVPVLSLCATIVCLPVAQAKNNHAPIDDSCWQQTFDDGFESLDLWDANTGEGQWHTRYIWDRQTTINQELQFYIDPREHSLDPFSIDSGILSITANKTPASMLDAFNSQPYYSGVLTTEKGFSQQYGRFEVRAQVPAGTGLWSAFWLLPSFDQWPEGVAVLPEIDVMEHLGHEPSTFHTTVHTNQSGELKSYPYDTTVSKNLTREFHLYSVVWTESSVDWYLDKQWVASHPTPKDFTKPVHFLLNLAVGGSWPGSPDKMTRFPARYQVDYVRAYSAVPSSSVDCP